MGAMDAAAKQAISELLARAAYALDHKDLAGLEAAFHEDATFTLVIAGLAEPSVFEGREAIMGLMKGALDTQTDMRRHAVSNLFYQSEDDKTATVLSYLTLMGTQEGETRLITTGLYTDRVVRDAQGNWVLGDRHLKLDRPY